MSSRINSNHLSSTQPAQNSLTSPTDTPRSSATDASSVSSMGSGSFSVYGCVRQLWVRIQQIVHSIFEGIGMCLNAMLHRSTSQSTDEHRQENSTNSITSPASTLEQNGRTELSLSSSNTSISFLDLLLGDLPMNEESLAPLQNQTELSLIPRSRGEEPSLLLLGTNQREDRLDYVLTQCPHLERIVVPTLLGFTTVTILRSLVRIKENHPEIQFPTVQLQAPLISQIIDQFSPREYNALFSLLRAQEMSLEQVLRNHIPLTHEAISHFTSVTELDLRGIDLVSQRSLLVILSHCTHLGVVHLGEHVTTIDNLNALVQIAPGTTTIQLHSPLPLSLIYQLEIPRLEELTARLQDRESRQHLLEPFTTVSYFGEHVDPLSREKLTYIFRALFQEDQVFALLLFLNNQSRGPQTFRTHFPAMLINATDGGTFRAFTQRIDSVETLLNLLEILNVNHVSRRGEAPNIIIQEALIPSRKATVFSRIQGLLQAEGERGNRRLGLLLGSIGGEDRAFFMKSLNPAQFESLIISELGAAIQEPSSLANLLANLQSTLQTPRQLQFQRIQELLAGYLTSDAPLNDKLDKMAIVVHQLPILTSENVVADFMQLQGNSDYLLLYVCLLEARTVLNSQAAQAEKERAFASFARSINECSTDNKALFAHELFALPTPHNTDDARPLVKAFLGAALNETNPEAIIFSAFWHFLPAFLTADPSNSGQFTGIGTVIPIEDIDSQEKFNAILWSMPEPSLRSPRMIRVLEAIRQAHPGMIDTPRPNGH